ncbi:hypothetical protein [Myxococcus eversor]|uniref:hypothetical protein n=1 Tax=Myxococcus eversor TaxID=2709661 RepID=UPI0013D858D7|nr:hypothetical protein [Myxococcus eversor]
MIRALEDDLRSKAPKEWAVEDRELVVVQVILFITGGLSIIGHVDGWWTRLAAVVVASMAPLSVLAWRIRRIKTSWRLRTGLRIDTLDDVQRCVEEEQARFVLEHPSVNRNGKIIEATIAALRARKEIAKSTPLLTREFWCVLAFFGITFYANSMGTLFGQSQIEFALVVTSMAVIVTTVVAVTRWYVRDFITQRETLLGRMEKALIGAKASLEGTGELAPWWKGARVATVETASSPDGVRNLP